MKTTVVNLNSEPYDIYIGRANRWKRLRKSIWANPFRVDTPQKKYDGDRDTVIAKYRAWLMEQPELLAKLPELKGKRLGCWCKPEACHGDVLAELAERL